MTSSEYYALKPGDVLYVRDFGIPDLVRKATFLGPSQDYDGDRAFCTYLEPDDSVSQAFVGNAMKPIVCFFDPAEAALTAEGLRVLLRARFETKLESAKQDVERAQELLDRLASGTTA